MLSQAVFERLMAWSDLKDNLRSITGATTNTSSSAAISEVVVYLFQCFQRLRGEQKTLSTANFDACLEVIAVNARTSVQTPDVYEGQDTMDQFFRVCYDAVKNDEDDTALEFFAAVLKVSRISFAIACLSCHACVSLSYDPHRHPKNYWQTPLFFKLTFPVAS